MIYIQTIKNVRKKPRENRRNAVRKLEKGKNPAGSQPGVNYSTEYGDRSEDVGGDPSRAFHSALGGSGSGSYMNFLQNGMSMPPIPLPMMTMMMNTRASRENSPADTK